jgi:hypothetical protein
MLNLAASGNKANWGQNHVHEYQIIEVNDKWWHCSDYNVISKLTSFSLSWSKVLIGLESAGP